jgi:SAM-dependent methyltransferase
MSETLYAERPDVYDVLSARKDYDAETEFAVEAFEAFEARADAEGRRALVVGCGTGEHSKRLREAGFEVLGVDKHPAMVERLRASVLARRRNVRVCDGLPGAQITCLASSEFQSVDGPPPVAGRRPP